MIMPLVRAAALCLIGACVASAHLTGNLGHDLGHELFGTHFDWVHSYASDSYVSIAGQGEGPFDLTASPHKVLIPCYKVTIPFINKVIFDLIEPCGDVTVGPDGNDFKTPFGTYHAPADDNAFSGYTAYFVCGLVVVYLLYNVASAAKRKVLKNKIDFMRKGGLQNDTQAHKKIDAAMSPEDRKEEKKDRMSPKSDNFICPANIFRLLSVLVPGKGDMTIQKYIGLCTKAAICAYMQIYMPYNILIFSFTQWSYAGVKSPLWFIGNGTTFLAMFAALGNVCTIFAAKCSAEIDMNAEACFFLCSMDHDHDVETKKKAPLPPMPHPKKAGLGTSSLTTPLVGDLEADEGASGAAMTKLFKTPFMQKVLDWNEWFWCVVNMAVTISSSVLLNFTMFMKVATFTGDVANIALIAVALYFVFDLDDKVMESSPSLKPQYRLEVLKQTKPKDEKDKPFWIKKVASYGIHFVHLMLPAGLAMIILLSWQEKAPFGNARIGGDPFNQGR